MLDAEILLHPEGCIVWTCHKCKRVGISAHDSTICRCLSCDSATTAATDTHEPLTTIQMPWWAVAAIRAAR